MKPKLRFTSIFVQDITIFLLDQLHNMKQEQFEPMDSLYMRVTSLDQFMKFDDLAEQIIYILTLAPQVNCTNEPALRIKVLKDRDVKLKVFINYASAFDISNRQAKEISRSSAVLKMVKKKGLQKRCNKQ